LEVREMRNMLKGFLKKKGKGFTLIELLIVIIIIGILFIVLIPRVNFVSDSAKAAGVKTILRSVQASMDHYEMLNSVLPDPTEFNKGSDVKFGAVPELPLGSVAFVDGAENHLATLGTITSRVSYSTNQLDPWGQPYIMVREENSSVTSKIAVLSKGPDGIMSPDPVNTPLDDIVILFLKN
jgi:general secretion pathway protein G